jgi:hypothetical protein
MEHASTPFPSVVFTFGFTIESIKELGGVSVMVNGLNISRVLSILI